MAGAGYKLFNTGDVLTAAQVNTYLQEQAVMRFANATARTTALSGVLAEGMVSYLDDTNTLEVYNGSAWVGATGDITEVQAGTGISVASGTGPIPVVTNTVATTFDAKGDLVVGTGADTFAKLVAGSNGDTLVADSSATTGLRWQGNFAAGKNNIINGDFKVNQRNFTSVTSGFNFDRWQSFTNDGSMVVTCTPQTFTPGTAPVTGYEGSTFLRTVVTNSSGGGIQGVTQRIEDVRTLAGQTVTGSFWAKTTSGTPKINLSLNQNFGSGGSTQVTINSSVSTISTSWARYTFTLNLGSLTGKTIGTSSYLEFFIGLSRGDMGGFGAQNATIDIWGCQLESGNTVTAFQTATGTLAGELAACQRYYYRVGGSQYAMFGVDGFVDSATNIVSSMQNPTTMRVTATSVEYSAVRYVDFSGTAAALTALTISSLNSTPHYTSLSGTTTGATAGRGAYLGANNNANAYIGISAEL